MIRDYPNELWKKIIFENYGRVIKKKGDTQDLVKVSLLNGYQVVLVKKKDKGSKRFSLYLHKLMGQNFLEKEDEQKFVIHLNYDKLDNRLENLRWASRREKEIHQFKNPIYKTRPKVIPTSKLTEVRVRLIKRKLFDPNRRTRLKMIAKQFGISTMQLHRIKTGENWGHVTDY